jgi:hypothetical protein
MSQQPAKKGEPSSNATGNTKNGAIKPGKGKGSKPGAKPVPQAKNVEEKKEEKKNEDKYQKSVGKACALLFVHLTQLPIRANFFSFGDAGPVVASSPTYGLGCKIASRVANATAAGTDPYFGVQLTFPRDQAQLASEDKGLGVCHACKYPRPYGLQIYGTNNIH